MNHGQPITKSFPQSHIFTGEVHRELSQYLPLQRQDIDFSDCSATS